MRVGVVGAAGRMGREVCRSVLGRPGLELVCAVDPTAEGAEVSALVGCPAGRLRVAPDASALAEAGAEVAVDFTHIDAARTNLPRCAEAGIHAVVGTTGATEADLEAWRQLFAGPDAGAPNCIVAPNFAVGAVL